MIIQIGKQLPKRNIRIKLLLRILAQAEQAGSKDKTERLVF